MVCDPPQFPHESSDASGNRMTYKTLSRNAEVTYHRMGVDSNCHMGLVALTTWLHVT